MCLRFICNNLVGILNGLKKVKINALKYTNVRTLDYADTLDLKKDKKKDISLFVIYSKAYFSSGVINYVGIMLEQTKA
jgi:hypothetical protein